jgi:nicotinamidase/pyrazinamidase
MKKKTVFWDVDTQFDFMRPEGALYAPGAESIIDRISEIRHFALDHGYSMLADIDWHSQDNPEISDHPDMKTTFPPHAMAGTPGAERVGYLGEVPIDYIDIDAVDVGILPKLVQKDQFHIVLRKQSLNVFASPNTHKLVDLVHPRHVVAFGVALDCCVYLCAQRAFQAPGSETVAAPGWYEGARNPARGRSVRGTAATRRRAHNLGPNQEPVVGRQ